MEIHERCRHDHIHKIILFSAVRCKEYLNLSQVHVQNGTEPNINEDTMEVLFEAGLSL